MAEIYRQVRRANTRYRLDRGQWAEEIQLIVGYDFEGVGGETVDVNFGIVFEGPPLYTWGVELQEDEQLTPDDFPHVSSGVAAWTTKEASDAVDGALLYLSGSVWFRVISGRSYRTRLRTSFRGISYKNPQYFQE